MMRKFTAFLLVFLLIASLSVSAGASTAYIYDEAGLLNNAQESKLNEIAERIEEKYRCSIYIMTVDNFRTYGTSSDVYEVTYEFYHDQKLGYGKDREGMILLLSMRQRDFALFCYGDDMEYAFSDYALEQLEKEFLDDFGDDEWYDGFYDYLTTSEQYLKLADEGDPVRKSALGLTLILVGVALVIALIATLIPWAAMRSARKKTTASNYMVGSGLALTVQTDTFTHQTRSVRTVQKSSGSSSGSSRSRSGGGGSGRSGKF